MEVVAVLDVDVQVDKAMSQFRDSIAVYWTQPHSVNKALRGADDVHNDDYATPIERRHVQLTGTSPQSIKKHVQKKDSKAMLISLSIVECGDECTAHFVPHPDEPISGANHYHTISMNVQGPRISVSAAIDADAPERETHFLSNLLLPKIVHLMQCDLHTAGMVRSVRLVDLQDYNQCYNTIKAKYSKYLIKNWTEKTNAEKFVHEDLAIAAYLLTYWKKRNMHPSFCDIGCGNGLLVYILIKEGFDGYGIDLRSRSCWTSFFGQQTGDILKVCVLNPGDSHFLDHIPEVDWYIGNHSDELTPWIAYVAARRKKSAFLLPCCAWDLFGKYQKSGNQSLYASYLDYVQHMCIACGLHTKQDRLQIPSTKRKCFIAEFDGRQSETTQLSIEKVLKMTHSDYKHQVAELLESLNSGADIALQWVFKPRPVEIAVTNCTKIPKHLQLNILNKIVSKLLEMESSIDVGDKKRWNKGGSITLQECSLLLTKDDKQLLKRQGHGIQTLLKNYGHIFKLENGNQRTVCLRYEPSSTRIVVKETQTQDCFYEKLHPQGCPFAHICNYHHIM